MEGTWAFEKVTPDAIAGTNRGCGSTPTKNKGAAQSLVSSGTTGPR